MGAGKIYARGNPAMEQHPIHGGVEIILASLSYRNWDTVIVLITGQCCGKGVQDTFEPTVDTAV